MKKLAAMLCLSVMTTGAFAQGLVNFANNPNTLVSATIGTSSAAINGPAGSYYFALLTSPTGGAGTWTFSGLYGTNISTTAGGRFSGGNGVAVPNWAAGTTMSYEVAAWESSLGTTFLASWLLTPPAGLFGVSLVGSGVAGGGAQSLPTLQLFGGTGITAGFNLTSGGPPIPEPSSMALFGLGAAALVIFRRRK
jgi:hypothetical protein